MDLYEQEKREPLVQITPEGDGLLKCEFGATNGEHELSCLGYGVNYDTGQEETPMLYLDGQIARYSKILSTCFPTYQKAPHFINCSDMNLYKLPATGRMRIFRMMQMTKLLGSTTAVMKDEDMNSQNRVLADMNDLFFNKLKIKHVDYSIEMGPLNYVTDYNKLMSAYLLLNGGVLGGKEIFRTGPAFDHALLYKLEENKNKTGVTVSILNPAGEVDKENIMEIKRRYRNALYSTWETYRNYRTYGILDYRELLSLFLTKFYQRDDNGYSLGIPASVRRFIIAQSGPAVLEISNALKGEYEKNRILMKNSAFTQEDFEIFVANDAWTTDTAVRKIVWNDTDQFDILYDSFYYGNSLKRTEIREYTSALMNFRGIVDTLETKLSNNYGVDCSYLFEEMTAQQARDTLGKNVITAANKYDNIISEKRGRNIFYWFPGYVMDTVYAWHRHREEFNLGHGGLSEDLKEFIPELPHEHPLARQIQELNAFDTYEQYLEANHDAIEALEEDRWEE